MTYNEMVAQGIDPARIPEEQWKTIATDPESGWVTQRFWVEKPRDGFGGISLDRKVNVHEQELLENNRRLYDASGSLIRKDTELDAKVASIPLNVFYNDQKLQDGVSGDRDMLKSWLNDDKNRIYRTAKGKI